MEKHFAKGFGGGLTRENDAREDFMFRPIVIFVFGGGVFPKRGEVAAGPYLDDLAGDPAPPQQIKIISLEPTILRRFPFFRFSREAENYINGQAPYSPCHL